MAAVTSAPPKAGGRPAHAAKPSRTMLKAQLSPSLAEQMFGGAFILMTSQALLGRLGDPGGNGEGAAWLRLMWLPAYAIILALSVRYRRGILGVGWALLPVVLLAGWALLSATWSVNPEVTVRRAVGLTFTTAFALYLASRLSWRALIEWIAIAAVALAIGSVLAAALVPSFAIQDNNGAWRGLWFEKNAMGGFMARGACACLCAAAFPGRKRRIWILAGGLCATLTILSASTTATLALGLAVGVIGLLVVLRRGPLLALAGSGAAMASVAGALVVATLVPSLMFDLTGKDPTLTGRTALWSAVAEQAAEQPLLGYGYAAFWTNRSAASNEVRARVQWNARNADNGWLDVLVQLGGVGLALMLWAVGLYVWRGAATLARAPHGLWVAASAVVFLTASLSESILARSNDCSWIFFVATLAKLSTSPVRLAHRRSPRRPPGRAADSSVAPLLPCTIGQLREMTELGHYAATHSSSIAGARVIEALPPPLQGYLALSSVDHGPARLVHPLARAEAITDVIDALIRELRGAAVEELVGPSASRRAEAARLLRDVATSEMQDAASMVGLAAGARAAEATGSTPEARLKQTYPHIYALLHARMAERDILGRQAALSAWGCVRDRVEALSSSEILRCIARAATKPAPSPTPG